MAQQKIPVFSGINKKKITLLHFKRHKNESSNNTEEHKNILPVIIGLIFRQQRL
jgi:hypothetical protein